MASEKLTKVAEASAISAGKSECCRSTPSLGLHNGPVINCRPPVNPATRPPEAGRVTTSDRPTGRRPRPLQACELRPVSCNDGMDSSRDVLGIEVPTSP
jgi:hypothetical protein